MIELKDRKEEILNKNKNLFDLLFAVNDIPKFILGINPHTDSVLDNLKEKITGVVDDFSNEKNYKGFNIYKTDDVPQNSIVIVCSIANRPITSINNLKKRNIKYIIDYFSLYLYQPDKFRTIDFWSENRKDIKLNFDKYKWLYEKLDDKESKIQLEKLINFRYNFDISQMDGFEFKPKSQYFDEDFISFSDKEVFIDGGGYCGESSLEFIKYCPDYKKIYFFEPSLKQMQKAQQMLKNENVIYYEKALYSSNKTLNFDADSDTANKLDDLGTQKVETLILDEIINEPVTFLKLDIEGAEVEALKGAKNIIKKYKPKLAICVYHNQSDYWRVPEIILSYNCDYKLYLRHYTEGILETVMYFI